jgi:hypothetical protein
MVATQKTRALVTSFAKYRQFAFGVKAKLAGAGDSISATYIVAAGFYVGEVLAKSDCGLILDTVQAKTQLA